MSISQLSADEAQEAEAVQVLNSIYDMREHQPNRQPEDMARVCHALAMLYFVLSDISKVCCRIFLPSLCYLHEFVCSLICAFFVVKNQI